MKPLKIAVNTRMLLKDKLDGTGWFAYQTLKRITRAHPEVEFIFLFDRKFSNEFIFSKNITPMIIWPPTRHAFLNYIWFQISVKLLLNKIKPDLFLSPDGLISLGAKCNQIAVIHDINFKHRPEDMQFWTGKFFNHYFPKYTKAATRIAAVSEFTKQDLIKEYQIDPAKIDIVYNAADENFKRATETEKKQTREKFTSGRDYFIFVGSISPRKNIARLLEAFDLFKKEGQHPTKLVIAGANFWGREKINNVLNMMEFKNDVIFTGRINDNDLRLLVASALCLTYVPYFEGFGVPLVEAMRSEVPIISANTTSMPEIAGNSAVYVNPFKVEEIKNAMLQIISKPELRSELIDRGKIQQSRFSWDKSALQLWECINKSLT
jgi:glycosyltransferase involved in cell wall biosynthesis